MLMQPRILLPVLAAAALFCGAASAQDAQAPTGRPAMARHADPAKMQQHLGQMCTNRYAHAVGRMAALEVQLNLTSSQKPLFERWKDKMLASAKERSTQCADIKIPDHRPTLVEREKFRAKVMQARLDDLKAQMPALEALSASLNADQQKVLARAAHEVHQERFAMMERMHDRFGHRHGMMDGRGARANSDGDPLPAPTAQ
jgi:hypothetical protein